MMFMSESNIIRMKIKPTSMMTLSHETVRGLPSGDENLKKKMSS